MPNIVAHNHIAAQTFGPEYANFMLGSTLPDFEGMHKAKYGDSQVRFSNPMVAAGRKFHKLTDIVYDSQPEIPQITGPLHADLVAAGIPYKAARMTTAFAADVLVDRALLDVDAAWNNYTQLRQAVMHSGVDFSGSINEELRKYVWEFFGGHAPSSYKNVENIAKMARRRLQSRGNQPDRRITEGQIPAATDVLRTHADRVGDLGLRALFATLQELHAPVDQATIDPGELVDLHSRVRVEQSASQAERNELHEGEVIQLRTSVS